MLVVEDDPAIANVVAETLDLAGYRVGIARDGLAALDLVRQGAPDVVVLDLGLPGLNGQEFLDAWRTVDPAHSVPILVLSAKPEALPEMAASGVVEHMAKPFELDAVVAAVTTLAASVRSSRTGVSSR